MTRQRSHKKVGRLLGVLGVLWFSRGGFGIEFKGFLCFGADQGVDKPSSAAAESSKRRKEQEQQQPAVPWAKLLSECSQVW
jgi:hypothetical protein